MLKKSLDWNPFMRLMQILAIVITLSILSFATRGAVLTVDNFCGGEPLFEKKIELNEASTVSAFTLSLFQEFSIPFLGAEAGLNSIYNTPTGMDALEVLSDSQMRAYGWCYTVNGELPENLMNQEVITDESEVRWFFGFSFYDAGVWTSYCTPAPTQNPLNLCL